MGRPKAIVSWGPAPVRLRPFCANPGNPSAAARVATGQKRPINQKRLIKQRWLRPKQLSRLLGVLPRRPRP